MGGAGGGDMEEVAALQGVGVVCGVDVEEDDVVELEALDLGDVGDVDAGAKGEVVVGDEAEVGDLGEDEGVGVEFGLGSIAGDEGDRGEGFSRDEGAEGVGEEGHSFALDGDAMEFDGGACACGLGRGRGAIEEEALGEGDDLVS